MSAAIPSELTCKELVELVTEYLEDRLPVAENTRFELHLCTCTACRVYLAQMRSVIRISGRLTEEDLPPATQEDLLAVFRDWRSTRQPRHR